MPFLSGSRGLDKRNSRDCPGRRDWTSISRWLVTWVKAQGAQADVTPPSELWTLVSNLASYSQKKKKSVRLRVNRRLHEDGQVLRFPPSLAPVAKACSKKATRSRPTRVLGRVGLLPLRRGAGVQDARALHPGAHGAQAGRQQRLLFQVEPTAGQSVLCGEHKDPQFVGAPHCQGSLPAEAVGVAAQPDPTAPGASRSAALHGVRSLSARSPLGCSLSESGSPGADAVPSPPGARGGEMEGFPRGLRAGEQTESGARTLARRRPRGALWRLPSAAVVGGGGAERPASCPPFPPASPRPPAAPARGADYHPRGGDCGCRARRRRRWRPGRQQQQQSRVPG